MFRWQHGSVTSRHFLEIVTDRPTDRLSDLPTDPRRTYWRIRKESECIARRKKHPNYEVKYMYIYETIISTSWLFAYGINLEVWLVVLDSPSGNFLSICYNYLLIIDRLWREAASGRGGLANIRDLIVKKY